MAIRAYLHSVATYLPEQVLTNQELAELYDEWTADKIEAKTGIRERHIATDEETSLDLAVKAAERLFADGHVVPEEIDYILLCTQSPDYILPTSACIIQERLGIPRRCGALDFNLGCSGFVYGLGLAKGLIETLQAQNVLLLTSETYSKFIHPLDKSVRTIFGDGAAATLVRGTQSDSELIGPFVYGTDGRGADNLIVPTGGARKAFEVAAPDVSDDSGNARTVNHLFMTGTEIFNFAIRAVPASVQDLLSKSGIAVDDINWFVFHQANKFMLEFLRKKIKLPKEKFPICMQDTGNTVSATIPIVLDSMLSTGRIQSGHTSVLVGFGVGYSWGATVIRHV